MESKTYYLLNEKKRTIKMHKALIRIGNAFILIINSILFAVGFRFGWNFTLVINIGMPILAVLYIGYNCEIYLNTKKESKIETLNILLEQR